MKQKPADIVCPQCNKPDTWQTNNPHRPFCSDRCKLIDLGDWANDKNRLPDESTQGKPFDEE